MFQRAKETGKKRASGGKGGGEKHEKAIVKRTSNFGEKDTGKGFKVALKKTGGDKEKVPGKTEKRGARKNCRTSCPPGLQTGGKNKKQNKARGGKLAKS